MSQIDVPMYRTVRHRIDDLESESVYCTKRPRVRHRIDDLETSFTQTSTRFKVRHRIDDLEKFRYFRY